METGPREPRLSKDLPLSSREVEAAGDWTDFLALFHSRATAASPLCSEYLQIVAVADNLLIRVLLFPPLLEDLYGEEIT